MTVRHDLDQVREDLQAVLADVLHAVLGEEPCGLPGAPGVDDPAPAPRAEGRGVVGGAPAVSAVLAVHDDASAAMLGVRLRVPARLAHRLAARMFACDEPMTDDVLDAVGELANIVGGHVKALLFTRARLSLPSVALRRPTPAAAEREGAPSTTLRARVLGDLAELTLLPRMAGEDLVWPPTLRPDVLEGQL